MDEYKRRRRRSRAVMSMFLDSLGGIIDDVDVATFDSDGNDLKALIVGIEHVQSGTGDPSPDNVRPITGHSSVNVIVSPTLNPLDGTITNIPLGTTVYGGTLDVVTGVLTVENIMVPPEKLATNATKFSDATGYFWYTTLATLELQGVKALNAGVVSNRLVKYPNVAQSANDGVVTIYASGIIRWKEQGELSQADYRTYLASNPLQLCYELATPTTIQLTGQQISTFLGTNHVWCDSGKIKHLEY